MRKLLSHWIALAFLIGCAVPASAQLTATGVGGGDFSPASGGGCLTGAESDGTNVIVSGGNGFTAGWNVLNTTLITAAAVAPDGTTTAAFEKEDGSSNRHIIYRTDVPISGSTTYTYSVYAEMNGRRYIQIYVDPGGTTKAYAYFDLQTGVVGDVGKTAGTAISGTPTSTIVCGVNGYYKGSMTFTNVTFTAGATIAVALSDVGTYGAPLNADSPSYTGDNTSGAYIWRPKVAQRC